MIKNKEIPHSSIVIVKSKGQEAFLFSSMDWEKRPLYFNRGKLLGGNKNQYDESPKKTLYREIMEEIQIKGNNLEKFASEEVLLKLRQAILDEKNLKEYKSFLVTIPSVKGGLETSLTVYGHTYLSEIPKEVFNSVSENIIKGLRLSNEGNIKIIPFKKLLSGNVLFAYASGVILDSFLREYYEIRKEIIPNPEGVKIHTKKEIPERY